MADVSSPPDSSPVRAGLLGLAVAAGLALILATIGDVIVVDGTGGRRLAADTGLDRHGISLLLLGAGFIVLGVLAWRGMRVAATGLVLLGLTTIFIVVAGDVPDLHTTGRIVGASEAATTAPAAGFYLESLGGVLALLAGGGFLLTGPARSPRSAPSRQT